MPSFGSPRRPNEQRETACRRKTRRTLGFRGARDRETLEGLLLTPTRRTQIVVGKFLAAFSLWPACAAISVLYFVKLTPDNEILMITLLWGGVCGTLLAVGMTGLGMIVSALSNSNKV